MGMSLMLRWGKGSVVHTWTGASGAPNTPRSNLRSDFLFLQEDKEEEEEIENALTSGPFIHWPHLPSPHVESWLPPSVPSGPSFSGKRASAGLRLPDLTMKKQHGGAEEEARRRSGWLRRAGRIGGRGRGEWPRISSATTFSCGGNQTKRGKTKKWSLFKDSLSKPPSLNTWYQQRFCEKIILGLWFQHTKTVFVKTVFKIFIIFTKCHCFKNNNDFQRTDVELATLNPFFLVVSWEVS